MLFSLVPSAMPAGYGDALLPLSSAKAHLRVDGSDEDDLILALRDAAIDAIEKVSNCLMGPRMDLEARFEGFGSRMRPGLDPATSIIVTAMTYIDSAGEAVALVDGDWRVGVDGSILPAIGGSWPTGYGPVTVTFDGGYADGTCPPALIMAAKMMLAHLYGNREGIMTDGMTGDIPAGVLWWIDRVRIPVI